MLVDASLAHANTDTKIHVFISTSFSQTDWLNSLLKTKGFAEFQAVKLVEAKAQGLRPTINDKLAYFFDFIELEKLELHLYIDDLQKLTPTSPKSHFVKQLVLQCETAMMSATSEKSIN